MSAAPMADYPSSRAPGGCPGAGDAHHRGHSQRRAGTAALLTVLSLLAAGCAASTSDPSARYFSGRPATAISAAPPDQGLSGGAAPTVSPASVARPDPGLTPGVVAVRDANAVCEQPMRVRGQIPYAQQLQVFSDYGIPFDRYTDYGLDYLVPLNLGGAPEMANLWPVPVNDVGFHEKERLNYKLRLVVCRGELSLDEAQQQIAKDWYSLWIRYAA